MARALLKSCHSLRSDRVGNKARIMLYTCFYTLVQEQLYETCPYDSQVPFMVTPRGPKHYAIIERVPPRLLTVMEDAYHLLSSHARRNR